MPTSTSGCSLQLPHASNSLSVPTKSAFHDPGLRYRAGSRQSGQNGRSPTKQHVCLSLVRKTGSACSPSQEEPWLPPNSQAANQLTPPAGPSANPSSSSSSNSISRKEVLLAKLGRPITAAPVVQLQLVGIWCRKQSPRKQQAGPGKGPRRGRCACTAARPHMQAMTAPSN